MNFCSQSTNIESNQIVIIENQQYGSLRISQVAQNTIKLNLPSSSVRASPSLQKLNRSHKKGIHVSSQKHSSINKNSQINSVEQSKMNSLKKSQSQPRQFQLIQPITSTKSAIYAKLLSKQKVSSQVNLKKPKNKQQSSQFQQNFYHKHQNLSRINQLYSQKIQKELKQCTFNPKTNIQLNQPKNKEQFYEDQINYHKKTNQKIQQIRQMIQTQKNKENTFKPQISKFTNQLTNRRARVNVHDRLYDQAKDKIQKQIQNQQNQQELRRNISKKSISIISHSQNKVLKKSASTNKYQSNFPQQIWGKHQGPKQNKIVKTYKQIIKNQQEERASKNRKSTQTGKQIVKQNLYKKHQLPYEYENEIQFLDCRQLIKQRQNRKKSIKTIQNQNSNEVKKSSIKNQQITLNTFLKQIIFVAKMMNLHENITFSQMTYFIHAMNFIQNVQVLFQEFQNQPMPQKIALFSIWQLLQGEPKGYILLTNLVNVLCALMGYHKSKIIQQSLSNLNKQLIQQKGLSQIIQLLLGNKTGALILSEKDSKILKNDYSSLYLTRFKLGKSKLVAKAAKNDQFTFKPEISTKTQKLADKYRERIIKESEQLIYHKEIQFNVPKDGQMQHQDLLLLDQKRRQHKLLQKRQQAEKQKIRLQNQSMTYRDFSQRSIDSYEKSSYRNNKSHNNLSHGLSLISHNPNNQSSKDETFEVIRQQNQSKQSKKALKQSRAQQSFKENNRSKSSQKQIPNFTKQVIRMQKNKKSQKDILDISPLLYLNVTMEGSNNVKIPVFQNDDFQSLTEKVRQLMNIQDGQQQRQKLRKILKDQIVPVLNMIGIKDQLSTQRQQSTQRQ